MPRPFCSREESPGWAAAIGARGADGQADLAGLWDRGLRGRPRRRPLVPGLARGSRAPAAAGGRATGFWVWASAAAPASAALALEADTAARTAAAPGALCFLFLPPMLQRRRQTAPSALGTAPEPLHSSRAPRRRRASSIRASHGRRLAIGPAHGGPASSSRPAPFVPAA